MVSPSISRTLRWLAGMEDDDQAEPPQWSGPGYNDPTAGGTISQPIQPPAPEPASQPSFAPEDYSFAAPDNPLARGLTNAGHAAIEAYHESGQSPFWSPPALAPARAAYIAERALPEIGGEIGAAAGRAAGGPDAAPYFTVPESVPIYGGQDVGPEQVGRFLGSAVTDPLTYVGAAGAAAAGAPVRRVVGELARGLPGVGEAELLARGGAGLVRRGVGAVDDWRAGNAERVAAADARIATEGSTLAPGTLGAVPGGANLEARIAAAEARLEHAATRLESADALLAQAADAGSPAELRAARSTYSPARSAYDEAAARVEQLREQRRMVSRDIEGAGYGRPVEDAGIDTSAVQREATSAYPGQPEAVPPFRDDAPRSISLNAGFGVVPKAPTGGAAAARRLSELEAAGAPESTLQKWRALADADVADPAGLAERLRSVEMVTPEDARAMLGERPEYLQPVAQFLLDQRRKVLGGGMTARDVGKAYYMTLMSMRSTAQEQGALQGKLARGFATGAGEVVPPNPQLGDLDAMVNVHNGRPLGSIFTEPGPGGRRIVRPESAGAAWVWTDEGQRALNALDEGEFLPDAWEGGRRTRLAFGSDTVGGNGALRPLTEAEVRAGKVNLTNLPAFVDELNAGIGALKAAGRESEVGGYLSEQSKRLMGIGTGKSPFIKQLLGFGDAVTIDAREINYWLSGRGLLRPGDTSPGANMARAASRWWGSERRVAETLQPRIQAAVDDLAARYPELTEGIDPADAGHILHHWIWDRSGGSATAHTDVMASQRLAGTAGVVPDAARPDRLASVNRVLGQGLASSVSGGVGAQINEQMNPDDPYAAVKGFAAGALVPPLAARGGAALARRAGRSAAPAEGALAAFGQAPGAGGAPAGGGAGIWAQLPGVQQALAASQRRAAAMAARGQPPLGPLQWTGRLAETIGHSSMLGLRSMTTNLVGNVAEPLYAIPKEAARGVARAVETGNPAALREPGHMAIGAAHGLWNAGGEMLDALTARGRYYSPDQPMLSQQTVNPISHAVATGAELGGRVVSALPDALFGSIARGAGEYRAAGQQATDAGLRGQAWKQRANQILADVDAIMGGTPPADPARLAEAQRAISQGGLYAKDQTFQNELGTVGRKVEKAVRLGNAPVVGKLVTPYFNTPWNMKLRLLERTPVGLGMNTASRPGTTRTRFDKYYDATVGSTLIAGLVAGPAMQGRITGSGPDDEGQRRLLRENGWMPQSTLVHGEDGQDYYVQNSKFGNYGALLNLVGEMHDIAAYHKKDATTEEQVMSIARRAGRFFENEAQIQGISDLLGLITDPARNARGYLGQLATRATPYASTIRDISTSQDPAEREIDRGKNVPFLQEVTERWQQGTGQRSALPQAEGLRGPEANPSPGIWAFFPKLSRARNDPVVQAFMAAQVDIPRERTSVTVQNQIPAAQRPPGQPSSYQIPLTPEQTRLWEHARNAELVRLTERALADRRWAQMPPGAQEQLLQGYVEAAATTADTAMLTRPEMQDVTRRATLEQQRTAAEQYRTGTR